MSIIGGLVISWFAIGFVSIIIHMVKMNRVFVRDYGVTLPNVHLMYVTMQDKKRGHSDALNYPTTVKVGGYIGMITTGTVLGVYTLSMSNQQRIKDITSDMAKKLKLQKKEETRGHD